MRRDRQIDYYLIKHLETILSDAGYSINVLDGYTEKPIPDLPAIAVSNLNVESEAVELGSRKLSYGQMFMVDIVARSDGELQDISDIIYRDSEKVTITGGEISVTGWGDNLITNPNFDDIKHWAFGDAGAPNFSYECIPIEGQCNNWLTCPFRTRRLLNPAWYLCNEFSKNGTYSLGLFTEEYSHIARASGVEIDLDAGTYLLSGEMWKEINMDTGMYIAVTYGDTEVASTSGYDLAHSQQEATRVWTTQTVEFTIEEPKTMRVRLSAVSKKPEEIYDDAGSPCIDNLHCAWDALGLFKQEITTTGDADETIHISEAKEMSFGVRNNRYESSIAMEVIDNKCDR